MKRLLSMLLAAAMIVGTVGTMPVSAEELSDNKPESVVSSTTAAETGDSITDDESESAAASESDESGEALSVSDEEISESVTESEDISDEESTEGSEADAEIESKTVTDEKIKEAKEPDKAEMLGAGELVIYLDDTADGNNNSKTLQESDADAAHGWSYDADTTTLTLESSFNGEYLESSGNVTVVMNDGAQFNTRTGEEYAIHSGGDLIIELNGTSQINMAPDMRVGIAAPDYIVVKKSEDASTAKLVIDHTSATADVSYMAIYSYQMTIEDADVEFLGTFSDSANSYAQMVGADKDVLLKGSGSLKVDLNTGTRGAIGINRGITFNSSGYVDIDIQSTNEYSYALSYELQAPQGTGTISIIGDGCPMLRQGSTGHIHSISPEMGKITLEGTWLPQINAGNWGWLPYNKILTNSEAAGGVISEVWDDTLGRRVIKKANGSNLTKAVIETASTIPVTMSVTDSTYLDYPEATVGEAYPRNNGLISQMYCAVTGGKTSNDDRYYFSLKDGSTLPAGLSINNNSGVISGTPTEEAEAGSVTIEVDVRDKNGNRITSAGTKEITIEYGAITIPVAVTGVSVDPTSKTLEHGEKATITATPEPEAAAAASIKWSSNHEDIAKVTVSATNNKEVEVEALKPGQATITARTLQGNHTATCTVTVTEKTPEATLVADEEGLFLTGLVAGAEYFVGPDGSQITFTADSNGCIEVPTSMYNKTIDIIKVNSVSACNSKPQTLAISVTLPEVINATFAGTPVVDGAASAKDDVSIDSIYLYCNDLSWDPAPTEGKFVAGVAYKATMIIKTESSLSYSASPAVKFNGATASSVSLGDEGKTITAIYTYPETSDTVSVTGVTLSPDPIIMMENGGAGDFTVKVLPENSTNKNYSLSTGDDKVAYIWNNYYIHPVGAGKTTLTVTTEEGTFTDISDVYVRYYWPNASQELDVLKGLVPGATYQITPNGKEACTAKAEPDGTISMKDDWYSTSLTIIRKHAEYAQCDSEEQIVYTDEKPEIPTDGMYIMFEDDPAEYVYTGSAIKPKVLVYNNGVLINEGTDYTVKYSNNINVKRDKKGNVVENAKVSVTGKGNLSGSKSLKFKILPKNLTTGGIHIGALRVTKGSKAKPIVTYGNYILGSKDYTQENAGKKFTESGFVKITGKGNFEGELTNIMVTVVDKSELHSIKADLTTASIVYDPKRSEDDVKALIASYLKIYDGADKTKTALAADAYEIIYPSDILNVGKKTLTITAKGSYTGSVTKKITVKPLAVKESLENGRIVTNAQALKEASATDPYAFETSGVTLKGKLEVKYKDSASDMYKVLTEGTDYKVTYSNNKAVSTDTRKATYTITFIGNYKGTPALKNTKKTKTKPAVDDYTFTIKGASIANADNTPGENVTINIPDVAYGKKADLYKSVPVVTVDGSILANKNYTVKYYSDPGHTTEINKNNKISLANPGDEITVYVIISGKGNYVGDIHYEYKVRRPDTTLYDFSKAKVTLYQKGYPGKKKVLKSVSYTGKPRMVESTDIDGTIVVEYKLDGKNYTQLTKGVDYDVIYLNNTNKGKATVLIVGRDSSERKFTGTKKTGFTIGAFNIKNSK